MSSGPLSSRCTQCNAQQKENARNLVVCIDSSKSKKPNQNVTVLSFCCLTLAHYFGKNTNVGKLFAKIDRETTHPEQYAFYHSGFGKRPEWRQTLNNMKRVFNFDVPPAAWFVPLVIIQF